MKIRSQMCTYINAIIEAPWHCVRTGETQGRGWRDISGTNEQVGGIRENG